MSIPKKLQPHLDAAFPAHFILVATVLSDGYAQVSPRGSVQVYDDNHLSIWERGVGKTQAEIHDGSAVTFVYTNPELRDAGMFFVRLYGKATVHRTGDVADKVWDRLIEPEKSKDPERKGFAVLVEIERVENLQRQPITD